MKSCAYCGRENPDEATYCRECGTRDFVVAAPSVARASPQPEPPTEVAEPECEVAPDGEAELCTACLFPNLPESKWCKRCGAPMSSSVMFLMPDAARAVGFVYRRAVETRPKLVVVFGIWLHFFPTFVVNSLTILGMFGRGRGFLGLAAYLVAVGGTVISASMLYRVTRNYFIWPRTE
jgi:Double zinc ribbon